MQMTVSTISFVIVMVALAFQMIWLSIARRAREKYLRDLASFRSPSSSLSRYYHWRVEKVSNSLIDAVVFEVILTSSVVVIGVISLNPAEFNSVLPIVIFVVIISSLSSIQGVHQIKELKKIEHRFLERLEPATDKIDAARSFVMPLVGSYGHDVGKQWFALYRISQRQDTVGWSLRDVLMDRALREQGGMVELGTSNNTSLEKDDGPGLD